MSEILEIIPADNSLVKFSWEDYCPEMNWEKEKLSLHNAWKNVTENTKLYNLHLNYDNYSHVMLEHQKSSGYSISCQFPSRYDLE